MSMDISKLKIKPKKSAKNWGLEKIASNPVRIMRSRGDRESTVLEGAKPRLDESSMFEDLGISLEQIVAENNLMPAWWLEEGCDRAKAICKIEAKGMDYRGVNTRWSGTGFLVAPNILCTNHHVLNSKNVARKSTAVFDFQVEKDGDYRSTRSYQLDPDSLFWTNGIYGNDGSGGLDVTFVAVKELPDSEFGFIPMQRQSFGIGDADRLNIVQHPDGRPKEVAMRDNEVNTQDYRVVIYRSDTEAGSSGAPVFNDAWELVALHHAAKDIDGNAFNEGIKFSAIAAYLETDSQNGNQDAAKLLRHFSGTDELMGFFGALGRPSNFESSSLESVQQTYEGEDSDIDIGFWNIEWFNKHWNEKIADVAKIIVEMNLDVWAFSEASERATKELCKHLKSKYDLDWQYLASESASEGKQITTLIWNPGTVEVKKKSWPSKVHKWFKVDSRNFDSLNLEAVHGKVFNRYPALYEITTELEGEKSKFNLVPLHLKARGEGSLRRKMASRLLVAAINQLKGDAEFDSDWIIGGDFNGTLESGDFKSLDDAGLIPLTAKDEQEGQFTYLKAPWKSLIDHIYVSKNLRPINGESIIVAVDKVMDRFLRISDHRPLLMRLSSNEIAQTTPDNTQTDDQSVDEEQVTDGELDNLFDGLDTILSGLSYEAAVSRISDQSVYYDHEADAVVSGHYWQGYDPNMSNFSEKVTRLLTDTHKNKLSYKPSRYVYPWVELQPNGQIKSVYSGEELSPETLIKADEDIDRKREEARKVMAESGLLESTELEAMLESQFMYNCEHVVPQSWYSKRQPMKGDLHHLFACMPRCNSFRSNFPYTVHEFERTMENCGRVEDNEFEPRGGKGAVARATLYFMMRYPGKSGRRYLKDNKLDILLRWHAQDPVSQWERHRNAAIFILQGNRNPIIDHPDWADKLDYR